MNDLNQTGKWLAGIRVIELGQFLAAPFGGMIFADLGAEVIKVERPISGDEGRRMGMPFQGGDALIFQDLNRGKRSVAIDLKTDEGRKAYLQLAGTADIVINNLRPGASEKIGVDAASTTRVHPGLIYCTLTALGHVGPMRLQPGYEPLVQAYSGLASVNGFSDMPAVRTGASVVDLGSGMWIVIAALAALRERSKTGKGSVINLSLLETALTWIAQDISGFVNENRDPVRRGNAHPLLSPYDTFQSSDEPIMLAVGNDRQFRNFCAAVAHPEWCGDERFCTNAMRLENKKLLTEEVAAVIKQKPADYWVAELTRLDVPCARFNTIPAALDSPQVESLGIFTELIDPSGQSRKLLGLPFTINDERPLECATSPHVGEHNDLFLT
ncbi:CaiB/BaiF CoA transferase family protein [Caballeronia sp. 15711]|uniref:CaiB/BaiF CoA transferase family protein n=1 Tax=Caballeronia sp. 15711 TaxID=3391029 RepID=UPI0039E57CFD